MYSIFVCVWYNHKAWGLFPLMTAPKCNISTFYHIKTSVTAGHSLRCEALAAVSMQCFLFRHRACDAVKRSVSQSRCDVDINQAHITCCLTYCSRWQGRSCVFYQLHTSPRLPPAFHVLFICLDGSLLFHGCHTALCYGLLPHRCHVAVA